MENITFKYMSKNLEQIGREIVLLFEEYGAEAEQRMKAGKISDSVFKGATRDLVAKELREGGFNISGKNADIIKKAILKLDLKLSQGDKLGAYVIQQELNKIPYKFSDIKWITQNIDKMSDREKLIFLNQQKQS